MADLEGNVEYWDSEGNIHNPSLRPLPKIKQLQNKLGAFGANTYNWLEDENFDSPAYQQKLGTILGLESLALGGIYKDPLINYGEGLILSYGKPLFKMFDKSLRSYGKIGKDYFRRNIKNTTDYNSTLEDDVYYPESQIGKIRYKYLDQLPKLKGNVRNSNFNRHIDNKYKRNDAKGFDNLKINFDGDDYAYQIRNNAINGHKEFYNIKPFKYVEEDYQNQYFNKLFRDLLDEGY